MPRKSTRGHGRLSPGPLTNYEASIPGARVQATSAATEPPPDARDALPAPLRARLAPDVRVERLAVVDGVLSLAGYGIRLGVERGHLAVVDGAGRTRRAARFARATGGIKRVLVRGTSFVLTGDALQWLTDIGATLAAFDYDGRLVAQWTPRGPDDARLRRSQALAPWSESGPTLTKYLLRHKLSGQVDVLRRYFPGSGDAAAVIEACLAQLDAAEAPEMIRLAEGQAAAAYWSAWMALPLTFVKRDLPAIPEHWRAFGSRISPLSNRQYNAANPANALLNYLNGLLESEARVACVAAGLDPGLGLFHVDADNRDSLALDLLEPARPRVEAWLIELLRDQVWTKQDFTELRAGVCRLTSDVCHLLAATAPAWHALVAPYARHVARELLARAVPIPASGVYLRDGVVRVTTGRRAPDGRRGAPPQEGTGQGSPRRAVSPPGAERAGTPPPGGARSTRAKVQRSVCRECGTVLYDTARAYCDECWAARREAVTTENLRAGSAASVQTRAAVKARRAERAREVHAERRAWEEREGATASADDDAATFAATILPGLMAHTTSQIARAVGLSTAYIGGIKAGKYIPHRRHWDALRRAGELIAERRERQEWRAARSEHLRERNVARYAWEREHGKDYDRGLFVQVIYPRLRDIPTVVLRRETGLTHTVLNAIKRGEKIPHPMHWETFARLAGVAWPPAVGDEPGEN